MMTDEEEKEFLAERAFLNTEKCQEGKKFFERIKNGESIEEIIEKDKVTKYYVQLRIRFYKSAIFYVNKTKGFNVEERFIAQLEKAKTLSSNKLIHSEIEHAALSFLDELGYFQFVKKYQEINSETGAQ